MSLAIQSPTVIFPGWFDDRAEHEHRLKGFLPEIIVETDDGFRYQLYFSDPVRLGQDLERDTTAQRPYFAEPNLVVVPEITADGIRRAVEGFWRDGYFLSVKPLE